MNQLKLSPVGKAVAKFAIVLSFIVLLWPFSGQKDAWFYNNMLVVIKVITMFIYVVWQVVWHKRNIDSEYWDIETMQKHNYSDKKHIFISIICSLVLICPIIETIYEPKHVSASLGFQILYGACVLFTQLLLFFNILGFVVTIAYESYNYIKSYNFVKLMLNIPIINILFEHPENKEKIKPTKKIDLK